MEINLHYILPQTKQYVLKRKIYVRVAPDGDFSADEFFLASGSGTDYYANVTGVSYSNYLNYYILTTTLT